MTRLTRRILRRPSALLAAAILTLVWVSAAHAGEGGQLRDRLAFMDSRHAPAAQAVLNSRAAS
jgi:hypothetical protein